jgi:hypothetical protein
MKTLIATFLMLFLFPVFNITFAQEESPPNWLVVSQNIVQMGKVSEVNAYVDSLSGPVLNELVDEGLLAGWGQFNHAWGDEWNVNFWYVTKDAESFNTFWNEFVKRMGERHPGAFGELAGHFKAHKDNMYIIRNQYSAPPSGSN